MSNLSKNKNKTKETSSPSREKTMLAQKIDSKKQYYLRHYETAGSAKVYIRALFFLMVFGIMFLAFNAVRISKWLGPIMFMLAYENRVPGAQVYVYITEYIFFAMYVGLTIYLYLKAFLAYKQWRQVKALQTKFMMSKLIFIFFTVISVGQIILRFVPNYYGVVDNMVTWSDSLLTTGVFTLTAIFIFNLLTYKYVKKHNLYPGYNL